MAFLDLSEVTRGAPRRACRDYRSSTIGYLNRAVATWQVIFGVTAEPFRGSYRGCSELARLVKQALGSVVSDDPRVQMSFQSIKKGLPDSCPCMESEMLSKLVSSFSRPPPSLPPGYLDFVVRRTQHLFPEGWDLKSNYVRRCETSSPPLAAVAVFDRLPGDCPSRGSRSTGGSLGECGRRGFTQDRFLDAVLHGTGVSDRKPGAEGLVVQSSGKPRPLTKFEVDSIILDPLHKTVYDVLSRQKWLLRGSPDSRVLKRAGFRQGAGDLVSGDYASATDNLSIEVAEAIMGVITRNARLVPRSVCDLSLRVLRPLLSFFEGEITVEPRVGQMMGSKLSFPLLCLQNRLAFEWSFRNTGVSARSVPCLINGDDILFQRSDHFGRWSAVVEGVGLVVETTKTDVSPNFGTINSTLLVWERGLLVPAWFPRMKMLRPAEHPHNLGKSFADFLRGAVGDLRWRSALAWFSWHAGELRSTGVSLPCLGFRGSLAHRLTVKFGLNDLPEWDLPSPWSKHEVSVPRDLVCEVDPDAFSCEEWAMNGREMAALKWRRGWRPLDGVRSALQWCLLTTARRNLTRRPAPDLSVFWVSETEFSFRLKNARYPDRRPSRKGLWKAFTRPAEAPRRLMLNSVFEELMMPIFEWLPTYEEVCHVAF